MHIWVALDQDYSSPGCSAIFRVAIQNFKHFTKQYNMSAKASKKIAID